MKNEKWKIVLPVPASCSCRLPLIEHVPKRTLALSTAWLPADNSDRDADSVRGLGSSPPAPQETAGGSVVDRLHLSHRRARLTTGILPRLTRALSSGGRDVRSCGRVRSLLAGIRKKRSGRQAFDEARLPVHHPC